MEKPDFEKLILNVFGIQPGAKNITPMDYNESKMLCEIVWNESQSRITALEQSNAELKKANEWISVEDRLPENSKPVWCLALRNHQFSGVFTKGHEIEYEDDNYDGPLDPEEERRGVLLLKKGWYEEVEQVSSMYDYHWIVRAVTHWRPLPEPPLSNSSSTPQG